MIRSVTVGKFDNGSDKFPSRLGPGLLSLFFNPVNDIKVHPKVPVTSKDLPGEDPRSSGRRVVDGAD